MAYDMLNRIIPYVFIIVAASFLGFFVENVWVGLRYGYFDNRGMMLPGLLGYGLAIIGVFFILGTPDHPRFLWINLYSRNIVAQFVYYVLSSTVLVSVGEIALGSFVEKHCQIEWWNYSSLPLHIGKYTSVFTSIGFGLMITILMNSLFLSIMKWAMFINTVILKIMVIVLFILLIADFLYEAKYMIKNKRINKIWKIHVKIENSKKSYQSTKRNNYYSRTIR